MMSFDPSAADESCSNIGSRKAWQQQKHAKLCAKSDISYFNTSKVQRGVNYLFSITIYRVTHCDMNFEEKLKIGE